MKGCVINGNTKEEQVKLKYRLGHHVEKVLGKVGLKTMLVTDMDGLKFLGSASSPSEKHTETPKKLADLNFSLC